MKNHYFIFSFLLLITLFSACNPDCELDFKVELLQEVSLEGYQVLVTATPMSALDGKRIKVGNLVAETKFVEDKGLIVFIPQGLGPGMTRIFIDDPDCGEKEISNNFRIVGENEFFNTPEFVTPAPPTIVIPTPVPAPPPLVQNAWFSPNDDDYCIWFKPALLVDGSEASDLLPASDLFEMGSQELSACGGSDLYHGNPVSGIVNKSLNIIQIRIDRTKNPSGDLGIEEFEGFFIDVNATEYGTWEPLCGGNDTWQKERRHMMLLTSRQTGRQLLMYQQLKQ